ncbi:MAG: right-handed parallel beta-helix repeat-containing protein, partial [Anaerolineales bacterium]
SLLCIVITTLVASLLVPTAAWADDAPPTTNPPPAVVTTAAGATGAQTDEAATQPASTNSASTNAVSTDVAATQPASTTAAATQPASTDAVATQPASTDVASTNAAITQSVSTEAASTDSAATQPASTDVVATQPPPTDIASTNAAATQPASTDIVSTEAAPTESVATQPASTEVASTDAAATQSASADIAPKNAVSTDQPAPTDVAPTDAVAPQPAPTQTSSTDVSDSTVNGSEASTVAALADSGSVLTDQNGNSIPLASTQAAEILGQSQPDPVVCPAGSANASAPGCKPGYTTITSAIAAASAGSVIFVESGTYTEQVVINESLSLIGAGSTSTIIQAPSILATDPDGYQDLVLIEGSATVVNISGFTISGPGPSGCDSINNGIYVRGGATANISKNVITHIRDNPLGGCQNGVAIRVGSHYNYSRTVAVNQVGTAKITNNTISDYQKGGIVIDNTGSYADIEGNTVEGVGATTAIAQNGIQISRGATATVLNNIVGGNLCDYSSCGPNADTQDQSAGILLYQSGNVTIQNNTVSNNDIGLYSLVTVLGSSASVAQNTYEDNRYENILADQGTLNLQNNTITGSNYGVWAYSFAGDTGNTIVNLTGNQISDALVAGIRLDKDSGDLYNPVVNGSGNSFVGNPEGVINNTTTLADFVGNWWGSFVGPMDNKTVPDACGLTQNNPSGTGNGVTPCVRYDPWFTANPFATSGENGSLGLGELSSLIIPITGGQLTTIDCGSPTMTVEVGNTDAILTGLCGYEVVLAPTTAEDLPGALHQNQKFVTGVVITLLKDGKAVDALPAGASIQVSYLKPSGDASIMAWNGSSWTEEPTSMNGDRAIANLDAPAATVLVTP